MGKRTVIFIIVSFLILASCEKDSTSPEGNVYTVKGTVINSTGPVMNATVKIDDATNWTTKTIDDGSFEINDVTKGSHKLTVEQQSDNGQFSIQSENLEVQNDISLQAFLLPEPVYLKEAVIEQNILNDKINLNWTKTIAEDFREYKIYRHTSSGLDETTGELIHVSTSRTDTSFIDSLLHSARYFYRVFVLNDYGQIGGSNIIEVVTDEYQNNPEIVLSELKIAYLNKGEELLFYFQADKGEFYQIAWFDGAWFGGYSANSVEVDCYENDQETPYFLHYRLLQMDGAPKVIMANASEYVYLKFAGYGNYLYGTSDIEGTFGIKVDKLDKNEAIEVNLGIAKNIQINAGQTELFFFDSNADSNYVVSFHTSSQGGAYDDQIMVLVSTYRENINYYYFKDVIADLLNSQYHIINLNAVANEKIYIFAVGTYWWNPTTFTINVDIE